MNLAAARTELKARGLDFLDDARATQFLADANQEFNEFASWPWLETTVTGTAPLLIPDLRDVLYVVDTTNGQELSNQDVRDIIDNDPAMTVTGAPTSYWLDNETVTVWPVSAVSLKVRYLQVPADVSADTDVPVFPTRYHTLWVTLAQARVYEQDENYSAQAQPLRQQADTELQNAANLLLNRMWDTASTQVLTTDPDSSLWRSGW